MIEGLKELNFKKVLKVASKEGSYSFREYMENGGHQIEGFCTSCEEKNCHHSSKNPKFKLSTISHGTHTADFIEAQRNFTADTSTWHEQPVMFVFESPAGEDQKYSQITYNEVTKKPVKEWYWIHKEKDRYIEFPEKFEKGKNYGSLVLSMINTFKLKNAYITNLVKCGLNNEQGQFRGLAHFSKECIVNCYETILKQEIEIVQPRVVFAFSKSVKGWLKKLDPELRVVYLPHPAGRVENKAQKLYYFWEVTQGLYDAGIISLEEVGELGQRYVLGSKK